MLPTPLAAVEPPRMEIPEEIRAWLAPLGFALAALFALWLVFLVLRYLHRRAYNLTKAETARFRKGRDPSFLKVDHEAREEALRRGDEYVRPADRVEEPAPAEPPRPRWSLWSVLCRVAIVIAALAHFGVIAFTMASAAKDADQVWKEISTTERISTVVSRYWIGFALAGIVLAAELIQAFRGRKGSD